MQTGYWRLLVKLISHQALASYMEHRGFSVRDLAERTGVNRSVIGHLRSGHRNTCASASAVAIEKALDAPSGSLFLASLSRVSIDESREQVPA